MTKAKPLEEITREEFEAFEWVRAGGLVNMFSPQVRDLAGISAEAHVGVIKHYDALLAKWPDVRER